MIRAKLGGDVTGNLKGKTTRDLNRFLPLHRKIAVALDAFLMIADYLEVNVPVYFLVLIPFND